MILAILIITGIMAVLLYFYQRAAESRELVMHESEFISVGRLFMEQITTELRTARAVEDQFAGLEGSSNSISFICTTVPQVSKWITSSNEPVILPPATDLKRVRYGLIGGTGTNFVSAKGLDRSEEMLLSSSVSMETSAVETNSPGATNIFSLALTNTVDLTNRVQMATAPPLTDQIKLLQFRYWNGRGWTDNWSGVELPGGVEITIGHDPVSVQVEPGQSSGPEIFRRVIYLPNSAHPANRSLSSSVPEEVVP